MSDLERAAPGILALECLIEIKHVDELAPGVGGLAHEQTEIDEGEHDGADVATGPHSPVLEHWARHDPEPIEGHIPASQRELSPRDMTALIEPLLAILEGGEYEQIRALVEPRLVQPNTVHDAISKCQFRHRVPRSNRYMRNGGTTRVPPTTGN